MPWEQVVGLRDLVIGDAGNRVGEPGVGIDAVQLCRFDQGVGITGWNYGATPLDTRN